MALRFSPIRHTKSRLSQKPVSRTCCMVNSAHQLAWISRREMRLPTVYSAVACLALLHSCAAFSWKPCEDSESKSSISSVTLSPESPYPGSTAKFSIDATSDVEVSAGSLSIGVSYHGFPIYTETKDLCQQTACPVKKGPVSVQLEEPFPVITPPGPYSVRITAAGKGTDLAQLFCLDVAFDVVPSAPSVQEQ